jgi:two-component system, chemotaxis family, protein-glutamate methylesterase/glutaminase
MTKLIVIGASEGGIAALRFLLSQVPSSVDVPIAIVLHIGSHVLDLTSLENTARPYVRYATDGELIASGKVYLAPPDHHLLVAGEHFELTRGPRENWVRPAVDPLFRSAAHFFGSQCTGLILSGNLNDGTAGLYEIKRRGGIAIVQDPVDAVAPGMPRSAIENVNVDWHLPLSEIPALLTRLVEKGRADAVTLNKGDTGMVGFQPVKIPTAYACPDCGGAMRAEPAGTLKRFVCHIGHAMTAQVLSAAQIEALEWTLESATRALNEHAQLCREMSEQASQARNAKVAEVWSTAESETRERFAVLKKLAEAVWLHPETT